MDLVCSVLWPELHASTRHTWLTWYTLRSVCSDTPSLQAVMICGISLCLMRLWNHCRGSMADRCSISWGVANRYLRLCRTVSDHPDAPNSVCMKDHFHAMQLIKDTEFCEHSVPMLFMSDCRKLKESQTEPEEFHIAVFDCCSQEAAKRYLRLYLTILMLWTRPKTDTKVQAFEKLSTKTWTADQTLEGLPVGTSNPAGLHLTQLMLSALLCKVCLTNGPNSSNCHLSFHELYCLDHVTFITPHTLCCIDKEMALLQSWSFWSWRLCIGEVSDWLWFAWSQWVSQKPVLCKVSLNMRFSLLKLPSDCQALQALLSDYNTRDNRMSQTKTCSLQKLQHKEQLTPMTAIFWCMASSFSSFCCICCIWDKIRHFAKSPRHKGQILAAAICLFLYPPNHICQIGIVNDDMKTAICLCMPSHFWTFCYICYIWNSPCRQKNLPFAKSP